MIAPRRFLPSIPSLLALEAVARLGSVTAAAQDLALTHSAVSRQLNVLEDQLGVALLRRDGRGVALTESGATAQWLSRYRSTVPIYALSRNAAARLFAFGMDAYALAPYLDWLRTHPGASDAAGFLADRMPTLARMLARFRQDVAADGLLRAEPGRRLFLDWSGQDRSEPNLTYNLRYLHGLQTAARLATALDRAELAANWAAQAAALRAQIEQTFRNGAGWRESPQAAAAQLPLALLLLTGVVTGHEVTALADQIIARSLDLDDGAPADKLILASPFMHHYVFAALDHIGRPDAIRAIIRARWGRWAMAGQATTWENWNVDFPDGSVCHGFSAHPLGWLKHTQTPKT